MLDNEFKANKKSFITLSIIFLLVLIGSVIKCNISKQDKITEEQLYNLFYEKAKEISSDEVQRKAFAKCISEKLQSKYSGNLDNFSLDKDEKFIDSITTECVSTITKISWTPEIERKMLSKFSSMEQLDGASTEKKKAYAQCVISALKDKYPNGLNGAVSQTEMDSIYLSCIKVLK